MEKVPAVPDIDIDNSPNCKAKGVDEQLKKASEELIKQLDLKWFLFIAKNYAMGA